MSRRDPLDFCDQTQPRLRAIVERSAPNPDRPKLSEEAERNLDSIERRTAATYAEMEEETFRIQRLAKTMGGP